LAAAREFRQRIARENAERKTLNPLAYGLALHFGEVAYGNIGAARRLDFTVIGPAVNHASRLQDLAKQLGRQVLVSRAFAREIDQPMTDLGHYDLRDIEHPQQVFTLP
jgi:adenylate cyclase